MLQLEGGARLFEGKPHRPFEVFGQGFDGVQKRSQVRADRVAKSFKFFVRKEAGIEPFQRDQCRRPERIPKDPDGGLDSKGVQNVQRFLHSLAAAGLDSEARRGR